MANQVAKARPHKRFFIDIFTRDISLRECILDLIDNSIDGLSRSKDIDLYGDIFSNPNPSRTPRKLPFIKVSISAKQVVVEDDCGGLSFKQGRDEIFNFGHESSYDPTDSKAQFGVYGVGLKRAIFKIGKSFEMISHSNDDGFSVLVEDLDEWVQHDDSFDDWSFPISKTEPAKSVEAAGTKLTIRKIREETGLAMEEPNFQSLLIQDIAKSYALFLDRFVAVSLNGEHISPLPIPFGSSEEIAPANKEITEGDVKVKLIASLAARNSKNQWNSDQAGWYISCNGRLVVTADKTALTGWGVTGALPEFVSKYRGFVGLVLFQSDNPLLLPWRTTKRGLNEESMVFQKVRAPIRQVSRPILTFLDNMYRSDPQESSYERGIADGVKPTDVVSIAKSAESTFSVNPRKERKKKTSTKIQYEADNSSIDSIRRHIKKPDMPAWQVGKFTFEEYMRLEGIK